MNMPQDTQSASKQPENIQDNQDPIRQAFADRNRMLSGEDVDQNPYDLSNFEDDTNDQDHNSSQEAETPRKENNVKTYSEDEYNKIHSRLNENRHYSQNANRKFASLSTLINELTEAGDLSEDHSLSLMKIIKNNDVKKPEGLMDNSEPSPDPFQKFIDIANPAEIENYVNYTGDENYINKIKAYNHFMYQEATPEERDQIYAELSSVEKNAPKLVKKMMEIGDNFLKEGFDEFLESGSIRKYIQVNKQKLSNKDKEFDKIKRDKIKSEYDEPTYGFEKHAANFVTNEKIKQDYSQSSSSDSPIAQAFADRNKRLENQRRR